MSTSITKNPDQFVMYTADSIENAPLNGSGLSYEGLFLFALICGGDYSKGINGAGSQIAVALAQDGLADHLMLLIRNMQPGDWGKQQSLWREHFCYALQYGGGHLSSTRPTLAQNIPDDFPTLDLILRYFSPLTSWSTSAGTPPDYNLWVRREPNIKSVAEFTSHHFDWAGRAILAKKLKNVFWKGVFLRMIISV